MYHVACVLFVADEPDSQPERIAMGKPHQFVERFALASSSPLDQDGHVGIRGIGPLRSAWVT